jgi:hypothetical protein
VQRQYHPDKREYLRHHRRICAVDALDGGNGRRGLVGSWARCDTVQGMYVHNTRSGNFNGVKRLAHSYQEMMTACQQVYDLVIPAMRNFAPGKT